MYACSAPYQPEHLLRDSLFIHQTGGKEDIEEGEIPLFPVCMGSRYWMAANQDVEKVAATISITNTMTFQTTSHGTKRMTQRLKESREGFFF